MSEALARVVPATQLRSTGWEMTPEQEKLILNSFLSGAPPSEARVLLEVAKLRKLNPFTRQIHFVKRWDSMKQAEVWSIQVGIDGFRSIAERTGRYDGQDEPEYEENKDGTLKLCKVRVYRKDWGRPAVGVAYFSEYVQLKKDGKPNSMWARGPHFMLAKCAEALAFRKAFPEDMSGLYAPEELGSDEASAADAVPKPTAKELVAQKFQALQAKAQPPPHDAETGEIVEPGADSDEPPEEDELPTAVPYGKNVGKPIGGLSVESLNWYLKRAVEKGEKPWAEALERELQRRGK